MKFGLYCTYDKVGEECSPVFQQRNDEVCKRVVKKLLEDSKVDPSDYEIHRLGTFDSEIGAIVECEFKKICDCSEFVPKEDAE